MSNPLEILYQDSHYVAIHKPAGLLVHRSPIAQDASEFVVQKLRDQLGQRVYPCHRLDRKTSGVLLLALDKESHLKMRQLWEDEQVKKEYLAIVRGFLLDSGKIDYDLVNEKGQKQTASTLFENLVTFEIPIQSGKFPTSRYSLVKLYPLTGRFHQLRKHMAHIFHPIIGDRPHGCNKQNKFFLKTFEMKEMCLHSEYLKFQHPYSSEEIEIYAPVIGEMKRMLETLEFHSQKKASL